MNTKILVGYSSKYGATAGIAEKIGEALKQAGLDVDVLPVKSVKNPRSYGAFVIGSALYMFQWRGDAFSFLNQNQQWLQEHPTWIFSSGPLEKGDPAELVKSQAWYKKIQPLIEQIKPRDTAVFHGAIDMNKLNFFERAIFKKFPEQQGDARDWDTINAWANKIAAELKKQDK